LDADVLVVGAGWAGATVARELADAGRRVLVVEQRDHIGGNAYDYYTAEGVLVHKYGAHIFHTNSERVWQWVSRFTAWHPYRHRVLAWVGGKLVPVPINLDTMEALGGEQAAREAIYTPYTRKQWGPFADQLDPSVLARVKVRQNRDPYYFADTYQGLPLDGYTRTFERILDHPGITVQLNTPHERVMAQGWTGPVVYSGSIDGWFGECYGKLPYRSARFKFGAAIYERSAGVVNYPSPNVPYTRVADFRQMTGQVHDVRVLAYEYPTEYGDPFWPVPTAISEALADRYRALAAEVPDVHFIGRLGSYRYYDMHQVIAQALTLARTLIGKEAA